MKPVTIPAQPDYAKEPDGIPFVLTQAERSMAALYRAQLIRMRREKNRLDKVAARVVPPMHGPHGPSGGSPGTGVAA